ncbi:DUF914 domain membrane protein [Ophiocordyceps camponoti-floridani]|uniref:DUF914 domain membrane protein n=1 Tax=Ophiocordyceps camponoti-floridani TaxID=2030778 RepID=A0A8H4VDA3_9HYPO|nr:DUF914 domain membrane protein [Ophiocordyceps camponoti-floridani]
MAIIVVVVVVVVVVIIIVNSSPKSSTLVCGIISPIRLHFNIPLLPPSIVSPPDPTCPALDNQPASDLKSLRLPCSQKTLSPSSNDNVPSGFRREASHDDNHHVESRLPRTTSTEDAAPSSPPRAPSPSFEPPRDADAQAAAAAAAAAAGIALLESRRPKRWYGYVTSADFCLVAFLGQVLALCITATNTFTTLLARADFNAPALQTCFNYAFIAAVFTTVFLVRDGPHAWFRALRSRGWRYLLLAALDVEANYFTVLAYQHTTILSAQLINFWSIVCVVAVSALVLKVRYRPQQLLGILVCCAGMGLLIATDHLGQRNGGPANDALRGDLFALLGATLYGLSNVFEEWLVSKDAAHHVLAFLGLFGLIINGVQAAIFDRATLAKTVWSGPIAGWLVGYTACLSLFYSLAPLVLRMASAAFFDVSLLTANFWGVIIGVRLFGYGVHFLYPLAFLCIVAGLVLYFVAGSSLGDAQKPWLARDQHDGVAGLGTAKLRAINAARGPPAGVWERVRRGFGVE